MRSNIRAFVAIVPPTSLQTRIAKYCDWLGNFGGAIKWVERDNIHITLAFLGDINTTESSAYAKAIERGVASVRDDLPAPQIALQGVGAFPDLARPRSLWVGVDEGTDFLTELKEAIDLPLEDFGYYPERRKYQPHLTLGRVKGRGPEITQLTDKLAEADEKPFGQFTAGNVILFGSELKKEGPIYHPIATIKL